MRKLILFQLSPCSNWFRRCLHVSGNVWAKNPYKRPNTIALYQQAAAEAAATSSTTGVTAEKPAMTKEQEFAEAMNRRRKVNPWLIYEPQFDHSQDLPVYPTVNIRLRGYDYTVLERYQGYVHKTVEYMGAEVYESFATAGKSSRVVLYKPRTSVPQAEYNIVMYERTVQVTDLPTPLAPLLMEVLRTNLPEGVFLTVQNHGKEDDEARYIPDLEIKALQEELKTLDDPRIRAKFGYTM